jgi:hypothetical protein
LLTIQAQIRRKKTKEDLRPFLTILGTSQRASHLGKQHQQAANFFNGDPSTSKHSVFKPKFTTFL